MPASTAFGACCRDRTEIFLVGKSGPFGLYPWCRASHLPLYQGKALHTTREDSVIRTLVLYIVSFLKIYAR